MLYPAILFENWDVHSKNNKKKNLKLLINSECTCELIDRFGIQDSDKAAAF